MNKFLSILITILLASTIWSGSAWSATQLKKTVCPSGCDYTSLESAMNANEQNLVTADKWLDVEISGTWSSADTTAVTIHNYTTDATRYINVYTTGGARHQGVFNTSKHYISISNDSSISIQSKYVTIDGIQAEMPSQSADYRRVISIEGNNFSGGSAVIIRNCILKGTGSSSYLNSGIYISDWPGYAVNVYVINTMIYNVGAGPYPSTYAAGISTQDIGTLTVYNSTVISDRYGIHRNSGTVVVTNTYASSFINTITQTTNASADTSAIGTALDNIAYSASNFTNVTSGSEDLRLVSGSALIDAGTDLSGTFTTDIDGTTRSGTWDIGADEYQSSAPASITHTLDNLIILNGSGTVNF